MNDCNGEMKENRLPLTLQNKYFEDILSIWDVFRCYADIVKEILIKRETDNEFRQMVNLGQLLHFERFYKEYFAQATINDIYECLKSKQQNQFYIDLMLFLCSFYLKQIFEDVELETRLQNKGSIWYLLNYLWYRDQEAYFNVIQEKVYELPVEISEFGILQLNEDFNESNSFEEKLCLIKALTNGIVDLKKTQAMLQFRTESILFANRTRQIHSKAIRESRSRLAQIQEDIYQKDAQIEQISLKLKSDIPRQEYSKINRQMETIQKEVYRLRNQSNKESKQLQELQDEYDSLAKLASINILPQLLHNPSIYIGCDSDEAHYYFFLHDPTRIFYKKKNNQWNSLNNQQEIDKQIKIGPMKDTKHQQLRSNIQVIVKLLQPAIIQDSIPNITVENQCSLKNRVIATALSLELVLSDYLATNNGRWACPEDRRQYRQRLSQALEHDEPEVVAEVLGKFLERIAMQERLEQQKDYEAMEEEHEVYFQPCKNTKRIVEDDSNEPIVVTSEFSLLEAGVNIVKKLPIKLFGSMNDGLRVGCIELVKSHLASYGDLMLLVLVMERIVNDYVGRKREKQPIQPIFKSTSNQEQINRTEDVQVKILRTRSTQKPQYFEGNDTQWDEYCKVCHQRGKVICCDTCPSVFHAKCLGLKQIPQGKWSCFRCLSRMEAQIKTRATVKKFQA